MMPLSSIRAALVSAALLGAAPAVAEVITPAGMRMGLEPPPGFTPASAFSGFENRAIGATIAINELPPEAFADARDDLTKPDAAASLARRGVRLVSIERPQRSISESLVVRTEHSIKGTVFEKWAMLLAGPGYTGIVIVNRPRAATKALPDAAVRRIFASVRASATPVGDPIVDLPFVFTESHRLKIVQTQGGSSVLLEDRSLPKAADKSRPLFVIARGIEERSIAAERNAYAEGLLTALRNFRNVAITRTGTATLDGLDGIEIEANAIDAATNEAGVLLQIVVFEDNGYYRLLGFVPDTIQEIYMPEFRAVIASFKPRRTGNAR